MLNFVSVDFKTQEPSQLSQVTNSFITDVCWAA